MITPRLSVKCLFVFSDLPRSQLTTLHQTYTFELYLANSVSTRLSVVVCISRLLATCDSHCLHFFTVILPNIVLTTTQDNGMCSTLLQSHLYLCLTMQCPHMKQVNAANFCSILQHHHCPPSNGDITWHRLPVTVSFYPKLCVSRCVYRHRHFIDTFQTDRVNCLTVWHAMAPFYTMVFTLQVATFGLWCSLNILIVASITSLPWQFRYFQPPTPRCSHFSFCYVS
jgi:hypothetical protein